MMKLIMAFCNFEKVPKNSSPARNGTPPVQHAEMKDISRLGGPHLQFVRGAETLMAHFVAPSRRSLLPKCKIVYGASYYKRMPSPTFVAAKHTFARQLSVRNTYIKFHEKPIKI